MVLFYKTTYREYPWKERGEAPPRKPVSINYENVEIIITSQYSQVDLK